MRPGDHHSLTARSLAAQRGFGARWSARRTAATKRLESIRLLGAQPGGRIECWTPIRLGAIGPQGWPTASRSAAVRRGTTVSDPSDSMSMFLHAI